MNNELQEKGQTLFEMLQKECKKMENEVPEQHGYRKKGHQYYIQPGGGVVERGGERSGALRSRP
jgi:hypothetical protein